MALPTNQIHFVLFPFMAQGHMIPMIDIAKLVAKRGVIVTIVTTPFNAARFQSTIARAKESGLPLRIVELRFPCEEFGLPKGCENMDLLPSSDVSMSVKFFAAAGMLQEQVENLFPELNPQPSCIISDVCLPYTSQIASKFGIPRVSFQVTGCFFQLCLQSMKTHYDVIESIKSDSEYFDMPGLPDKIKFTRAQLPLTTKQNMQKIFDQVIAPDLASNGVILNSFEELEPEYAKEYQNIRGKVWCIGPVSLCNKDSLDKAQRGNDTSIPEHECLKWLDTQEPQSVVYVCLGSLCNLSSPQLIELGLGLEASKKPFLWVIRRNEISKEIEKWILESGFEERTKERGVGFLIHGFAPQVLILSHPAIGGFMTHSGWNSTLEGLTAGIPLITWPLFGDQFSNEKLAVEILKVGVRVGVERPIQLGAEEERIGALVNKEDVRKAIQMLMEEGKEGQARRERAKELGRMAKRAVEEGGSSHLNTTMLIDDIMQLIRK